MKTKLFVASLITAAAFCGQAQTTPDIDECMPVIVKTVPEAGSTDVAPGEMEIKAVFSKEMADQSWSWCTAWDKSMPEMIGKPHYESDHKTCVLKVKLEPGKTYGIWLNTQKFTSFQDPQHRHAVPYLLSFKTKSP